MRSIGASQEWRPKAVYLSGLRKKKARQRVPAGQVAGEIL
jgi:hypothetical protein